jgi:hypothetical protein
MKTDRLQPVRFAFQCSTMTSNCVPRESLYALKSTVFRPVVSVARIMLSSRFAAGVVAVNRNNLLMV